MAQKRLKSETMEGDHKYGLAKVGIEAAALARKKTFPSESADFSKTSTNIPEEDTKVPDSATPSVAALRRKLQSQSDSARKEVPKTLPRIKSAEFSNLLGQNFRVSVAQKQPPPPVAPKPISLRQLKQSPVDTKENGNSRRNTLPQNWKSKGGCQPSDSTTDKNEDVNPHLTTEGNNVLHTADNYM